MSESINLEYLGGPVEIARHVEDRAINLSRIISQKDFGTMPMIEPVIGELDQAYPFLDKKVCLNGWVLTQTLDDNGSITGRVFMQTGSTVEGVHKGFGVVDETVFCEGEAIGSVPRIAHVIQTSEESYHDEYNAFITKRSHSLVMVEGATTEPDDIEGVHSLNTLRDDPIAEAIDLIALNGEHDPDEMLERIQQLFIVPPDAESQVLQLWQQRVSYLNSLGLLNDNLMLQSEHAIRFSESGLGSIINSDYGNITFESLQRFDLVTELYQARDGNFGRTSRLRLGISGYADDELPAICMLYRQFQAVSVA